jgi:hypothetical protein
MPDYSKGKIYKIVVDTDEEYKPYVGSTCQELSQRMTDHRKDYKKWKKEKATKCFSYDLFDKFGIESCQIILLEEYPCDSKIKLIMKEREWFDKIKCCNERKPFISKNEKNEYNKKWYETNKEQRKEPFTCVCGSIICKGNKLRHDKSQKHISFISQN